MAPKTYFSPFPSVPIVSRSIFTHIFSDSSTLGGLEPSLPAFIDAPTGTTLTRGELKHLALSLGHGLQNIPEIPLTRGDTILIYSPNSLAWPVVVFGSVAAGIRSTFANSAYNARELAYQYQDSGAKLLFSHEAGISTVQEMFKSQGLTTDEADKRIILLNKGLEWAGGPSSKIPSELLGLSRLQDLLSVGTLVEEENFDGKAAHETVHMCYSSGTTGKPKGVETTHKNLTTVTTMLHNTYPTINKILAFLPFYHIYAVTNHLHLPVLRGFPLVIMSHFDPDDFCSYIERYKPSLIFIVPPTLVTLARHPAVDKYDLSAVEILSSGAAPLAPALTSQVHKRLLAKREPGKKPLYITQGYGLTETSPTTHFLPTAHSQRKLGSIGLQLPNLQCRLVNSDVVNEIDAAEGEPGELWIRGETVMKGYLNNIKATRESITGDGWFKTGDVAIRDEEGFYFIVDRRKELIKYKGFQVPPAELESVLLTHPDVADAAVIGVESAKEATELPRAYVIHADPQRITTEAQKAAFGLSVQQWMRSKVAHHKFLRGGVVVIDLIPKSAAGKILRRELRDRAKEELSGKDPGNAVLKVKL